MSLLDSTMLNIALPNITKTLATEITTVQWLVTAYLLVITSTLLVFGRLGDMFGRKQIYVGGFALFTAGSALCGVSQNIGQLIVFRVVQGLGSAMMMAISPAIGAGSFLVKERGKALGLQSVIVATGSMTGPTLGGFLIDMFDWRTAFFLRVPIGIIGTITAVLILRKEEPLARNGRFDVFGAAALLLTLLPFMLAVGQGQRIGWGSPIVQALFSVTLIFAVALVLLERRMVAPLLQLSLFRNRLFVAASSASLMSFMAGSTTMLLMPFFLQQALGYPAMQAGMMLIPQSIIVALIAPISGWLSDRLGSRVLATSGMCLSCTGLLLLTTLGPEATYRDVLMRLVILGVGSGIFQSPNNSAIINSVSRDKLGLVSSTLAMMRNMGMTIGTALAASVFAGRLAFHTTEVAAAGVSGEVLAKTSLIAAFHDALIVAAVICSIGIFASLVRGSRVPAQEEETPLQRAGSARFTSEKE
jgi:EmrB/QacA subfamily drug resistance transporter